MFRKCTFLLLFFASLALQLSAQLNFDYTEGKILIKGQVIDIKTKSFIKLANIKITNRGQSYTCDNDGYFTMYVYRNDTLKFSSTSYISKTIHISDLDSAKYYTLQIQLMPDFVTLQPVTIYPFKTVEEFKQAFNDAKDPNKLVIPGIAQPKYSNQVPKAKLTNPVSLVYQQMKKKRAANPDFKP